MMVANKTKTENQYMLVNVIEELVKNRVKQMMEEYEMCRCEKCYLDTCALVLNSLKPQYVTTNIGSLLAMLSDTGLQYITDLTVKVLNALKLVKAYPRH
jgi:competence protein ComFB